MLFLYILKKFEPMDIFFSEYSEIMDEHKGTTLVWNGDCQKINENTVNINISGIKDNICHKAMPYLLYIHDDFIKHRYKEGLKYLYFWLCKERLNDVKDSETIKKLYNELLNVYNNSEFGRMKHPSLVDNINGDEWKKITDICNLNIYLNDVKESISQSPMEEIKCNCANECAQIYMGYEELCKSDSKSYFCKTLENIRNVYNNFPQLNKHCTKIIFNQLPSFINQHQIIPKSMNQQNKIPSFRTNKSGTIIILTLLILLIPIFLFVVYKVNCYFTPYDSFLRRVIIGIKNMCHTVDKGWNMFEPNDMSTNISRNSIYNILHDSTNFYH
ncbi:variable surface protein [Plasmodium gonderi]|uniref:Variable surface protein n=1 Tax=Plasmodium gonderi TaxID=77519 RepID=A0A1Y1JUI5_PLAGO|nr:variable surface protein [Plasmodium gonderi]GAW84073.1 variable surface protein [Plasmodium gonderi]